MESEEIVSGEFQRSTRMPLDAVVRLHFQGTVAYQNGFAANVSATGMFVKHPAPPPLGTELVFEFNLGGERKPVQGAGEVVWVRERYLGPGQPAGVGIRFLQLDTQSRDHIAEALFEFLEQSLAEDSLLDSSGFSYVSESAETASLAATPPPLPTSPTSLTSPAELLPSLEGAGLDETLQQPLEPVDWSASAAVPAPEPFDFAALEKLPPRGGGSLPVPESKRPFSVFSPIDEADRETADIVREALREPAPLPSMAAAAAARDRSASPWPKVLLVLLLLGGAGYLAWRQWGAELFGGGTAKTPPVPSSTSAAAGAGAPAPAGRRPEPLTAAPAPGSTLAQQVGVDAKALSPAALEPRPGATTAPPEEPSDVAAAASDDDDESPAGARPAPVPVPASAPTAAQPRPPATDTSAAPPAAQPPAAARAGRLVGIAWSEAGEAPGQTALVLTGDAAFVTGSYSYSEIGGENPRVLIKLKGMQNPYRGPAPRGAGALVRGVRTGFHLTSSGNEIHVVVDLAKSGIKVVSLAPASADGSALTLRLAP